VVVVVVVVAMVGGQDVVVGVRRNGVLEDLRFHWRREEKEWVTWWINPIDREFQALVGEVWVGSVLSIGGGGGSKATHMFLFSQMVVFGLDFF
jgi:hypothetical protein